MLDIEPADYLPGAGGTLLEPGQRADAEIRIVDPGKDGGRIRDRRLPAAPRAACAAPTRLQTAQP